MARHSTIRREQVLKRKNFFPTLLVTIFLWLLSGVLIYFVDPGSFGAVPAFFALITLTFLFTFSLLLANSRRGAIATIALVTFLILAYLGIGNILNFILIVAIATSIELYSQYQSK